MTFVEHTPHSAEAFSVGAEAAVLSYSDLEELFCLLYVPHSVSALQSSVILTSCTTSTENVWFIVSQVFYTAYCDI